MISICIKSRTNYVTIIAVYVLVEGSSEDSKDGKEFYDTLQKAVQEGRRRSDAVHL